MMEKFIDAHPYDMCLQHRIIIIVIVRFKSMHIWMSLL